MLLKIKSHSQSYTFAMLMGVLLTFTLPPYHIIALLFLSFSGLYTLIANAESKKQAFWIGSWFGLGYFSTNLYWFAFPLIDVKFIWLTPFAVFGLSFLFSIYFALASVIIYIVNKRSSMVFSLFFTIAEWLLGNLFTGFPWNLFAYSWSFSLEIMQITSVIGIYGLVFITIFCAASPAAYFYNKKSYVIAIVLLVSIFLWGKLRLDQAEEKYYSKPLIRLVQGNISKGHFSSLEKSKNALMKYIHLTRSHGFEKLTHVIWPESAVPFVIDQNNKSLLDALKYATPQFLITGGLRWKNNKICNSLFVIDSKGEIVDYYDKYHLVPFGEFVPYLDAIAKIIPQITGILGNFAFGSTKNKNILLTDTPPFTPLICYEAIFPGEVINKKNRAEWLVNITNDVWFGISTEGYQHFAMSRVRAIEEGVPLIRAANNGMSAVIDSYGRVIKYLPLNTEGFIDTRVPLCLDKPTIYSRYNNLAIIVVVIGALMLLIFRICFNKKIA